jgi:hypothetical protein
MVDAVTVIRQRDYSANSLGVLLREILDGTQSPETIAESLVGKPATYSNIKATMSDLEAVAEHDNVLGVLLMTGLYGLADSIHAHDVCDGIELWIENSAGRDLVDALESINPPNDAAETKRMEWLRMLRND